jgi:hypothetical protein
MGQNRALPCLFKLKKTGNDGARRVLSWWQASRGLLGGGGAKGNRPVGGGHRLWRAVDESAKPEPLSRRINFLCTCTSQHYEFVYVCMYVCMYVLVSLI